MAYTLDESLSVMRYISTYLSENKSKLEIEGVLREAGNDKQKRELIQRVIEDETPPLGSYSVHTLLSAIKTTNSNDVDVLFANDDPLQQSLKDLLKKPDEANPIEVMTALADLVTQLVNSGDEDNLKRAEIIHDLTHLSWQVTQFQAKNKMAPENVSIACLGPFLLNAVNLAADAAPLEKLSLTVAANTLGAKTLQPEANAFSQPFEQSYRQALTNLQKQRSESQSSLELKSEYKSLKEISKDIKKHYLEHRKQLKTSKRRSFFTIDIRRRSARNKQVSLLEKALETYLSDPLAPKNLKALQTTLNEIHDQLKKEGKQKIGGMEALIDEIGKKLDALHKPPPTLKPMKPL